MNLQPGDVPCYVILGGIHVPRVIGKGGAIIKELRQESGATVNILDRPPAIPEAFQRADLKVALINGSDAAMHTAVTGLIRNARGPDSIRSLEPSERDDEVVLFVPEHAQEPLSACADLLEGTGCNLRFSEMEGVRRHRCLHIMGTATEDLQIVAWRVHEVVLRLARAGHLVDRDFDLQDSSWDDAMQAFQARRRANVAAGGAVGSAAGPPVAAGAVAQPLAEAAAFESQVRRRREASEREAQEREERERRARVREAQARDAKERHAAAVESTTLANLARETWERANQVRDDPRKYEELAAEARSLEMRSREAYTRSVATAQTKLDLTPR